MKILEMLLGNLPSSLTAVLAGFLFGGLIISLFILIVYVIRAIGEGREVSLWPPRVGPKLNNPKETALKDATVREGRYYRELIDRYQEEVLILEREREKNSKQAKDTSIEDTEMLRRSRSNRNISIADISQEEIIAQYEKQEAERTIKEFLKNDCFAFLYKYYQGISLQDWIINNGPINNGLLDVVIEGMINSIAPLHSEGIIHRDIQPSNVILNITDNSIYLIDMEDICYPRDQKKAIFFPGFTSIEQMKGKAVFSSDLFSFAATVYFIATGKIPPDPRIQKDSYTNGETNPFLIPSQVFDDFSYIKSYIGLDYLNSCWSIDPDSRPLSAVEIARKMSTVLVPKPELEDIDSFLSTESTVSTIGDENDTKYLPFLRDDDTN